MIDSDMDTTLEAKVKGKQMHGQIRVMLSDTEMLKLIKDKFTEILKKAEIDQFPKTTLSKIQKHFFPNSGIDSGIEA